MAALIGRVKGIKGNFIFTVLANKFQLPLFITGHHPGAWGLPPVNACDAAGDPL